MGLGVLVLILRPMVHRRQFMVTWKGLLQMHVKEEVAVAGIYLRPPLMFREANKNAKFHASRSDFESPLTF